MVNDLARTPVKRLVESESIKKKFEAVLDKRAPQFLSSLTSAVSTNPQLQGVDQLSVINSAMVAATLDLPINPSLGFAYIVPFKGVAQPQIGYKGYIQLAQRSGRYSMLNALPVYEDEFGGWNPLTEELDYTPNFHDREPNEKPIGYAATFQLTNGFRKMVYWSYQQVDNHRKKFSQMGGKGSTTPKGVWASNYEAMALKTVIKSLLTKWGPMTVDMQAAIQSDEETAPSVVSGSDEVRDVTPTDDDLMQGNEEVTDNGEPDTNNQALIDDFNQHVDEANAE